MKRVIISCLVLIMLCVLVTYHMDSEEKKQVSYATEQISQQLRKERKEQKTEETYVYPGGIPIGLYLKTEGVLVVRTETVIDANGNKCCPCEGKVKEGDYIISMNGNDIYNKAQLSYYLQYLENDTCNVKIRRNEMILELTLEAIETKDGDKKLGIWVRDDAQGIGTLTYIMEDGSFGALGHGVSDIDTRKLLESNDGELYKAHIWGIKKGMVGDPGGLCGFIRYEESERLGTIEENSSTGLKGHMNPSVIEEYEIEPIPMANASEMRDGDGVIRLMVDQRFQDYKVKIKKRSFMGGKQTGFIIEVVDEELIQLTGGIVQGMSGSPIIQNGKMIGAVTHVFVNDPTRGYGIFIEEMLGEN